MFPTTGYTKVYMRNLGALHKRGFQSGSSERMRYEASEWALRSASKPQKGSTKFMDGLTLGAGIPMQPQMSSSMAPPSHKFPPARQLGFP